MNTWERIDGSLYRCLLHAIEFSTVDGRLCAECVAHPKRDVELEMPSHWMPTTIGAISALTCSVHATVFLDDEACVHCIAYDADGDSDKHVD